MRQAGGGPGGIPSEPVTVLVARQVAPGRELEFQDWANELTAAATHFAGFLGAGVLRPARTGELWQVVYRFDTAQHLAQWETSASRAAVLTRAQELMRTVGVHRVSGLETWFDLPGRTAPSPPRWKMFLASGTCIYALQFVIYAVLGAPVRHWPLAGRLLLVVPLVTALMTWLVMPNVTRLLADWLYPPSLRLK